MSENLWWKNAVIYQIYPRSFCDSSGDGIGDLAGIKGKLDYLEHLGVDAIWLSPINPSPMKDFGYDVSDYRNIEPIFGTMTDLDNILDAVHKRGMKFLMDLVPNHTSNEHEWFKASIKKQDPYTDYYIWNKGKVDKTGKPIPPNNWHAVFGGLSWTWCEERQEFYYHQFYKEQPDLNYRNPKVVDEMDNVIKFWLDKNVDGFRVDADQHLFEAEHLQDEPVRDPPIVKDSSEYMYTVKKYTSYQPETIAIVDRWDKILQTYSKSTGRPRFMVHEVAPIIDVKLDAVMDFYRSDYSSPFNFQIQNSTLNENEECGTPPKITDGIHEWLSKLPNGRVSFWATGNHDNKRVATRLGKQFTKALNTLIMTLPGTVVTFQGEELGLEDVPVTFEQVQDPVGKRFKDRYMEFTRDPCRAPLPWNSSSPNAGFTTPEAKPWLPMTKDYEKVNVEAQLKSKDRTDIKVYLELIKLRKNLKGTEYKHVLTTNQLLCYDLAVENVAKYRVLMNLSKTKAYLNSSELSSGIVVFDTLLEVTTKDRVVNFKQLYLAAGQALVIKV